MIMIRDAAQRRRTGALPDDVERYQSVHGPGLKVPVALVVFNRPAHTERVFGAIAAARPEKLFVIADGPRADHPGDAPKIEQVRDIVQNVTWPCELRTDFADRNMGCGQRTASGVGWVLSEVEEAIFLEDDTLPHPTFFRFCEEMLARFRDDRRIMSICGYNQFPCADSPSSYFFSALANPWGRAIWRRSWACFDRDMTAWPEARERGLLRNVFSKPAHLAYWHAVMEHAHRGGFDSYAYPFMLSCWLQNGLCVVPARNLVRNIGFGRDSTHTKVDPGYGRVPVQGMEFPLRHPSVVMPHAEFDRRVNDSLLPQRSLWFRARNKLRIWADSLARTDDPPAGVPEAEPSPEPGALVESRSPGP